LAKERIRAAAEVARALPFPFMLTARADQYLWGRPDLAEVIRRAQAFETAGANAIMVPGLSDLVALKSLCDAVSLPVVVLIGAGPGGPARERLAATGAKRIGVGGAMVRAALSAFVSTARDLIEGRELDGLRGVMSGREITDIFPSRLASS
jgi:2-methylisocitrate lyase-like PEP mutase family enzyme